MKELMEGMGRIGEDELWDRFWMRRNLPGLPAFGMRDKGAVWKGPMRDSISVRESGLR